MSSAQDHVDLESNLQKGRAPTLDTPLAVGSPLPPASQNPLSPTFGATFSSKMSPGLSESSVAGQAETAALWLTSSHQCQAPLALTPSTEERKAEPFSGFPFLNERTALDLADMKMVDMPEIGYETLPAPAPAAPCPSAKIEATRKVKFILWFNTYRKFFTLVVTFNAVGILLAALDRFPYARHNSGAVILGNLMTAVLMRCLHMRNEIFGRLLYLLVNTFLAKWPPLCIRLAVTSALQHLGGIHSGCALSGTGWLIFRMIDLIVHATQNTLNRAVIATGVITSLAICITVLSAFPWVRNNRHNVFERHHRFTGWLGLAFTWIFVVLGNGYDDVNGAWDWEGSHIVRTQDLYFVSAMTVLIALPWCFTRKVPVTVEIASNKVAIIRFERGMQQGLLGRIGRTSILEYHAFGIISEGKHAKYHYMVVGVQGISGDFTRALVDNPPTHVWTRELKFAGVSNTSTLYKRGVRIATGTGIGAALSTCLQSKDWFLIWIGSDQEKTFGKTIAGLIESGVEPERRILWDTKKLKRPDTMKLLKETYDDWGAEVVFITSNLGGNTEMMEGCKTLGIPAFGTLWDF